jgi:hypothetical protein
MRNVVRPHIFGYTTPWRYQPEWYAGNLVFQAGAPRRRAESLTGGGQIYGHELGGTFQPYLTPYSTPVTNLVAGGQVNARPAFLQALFGGAVGTSS